MRRVAFRAENVLASLALIGVAALPLGQIFFRSVLSRGIPGAAPFASTLTMCVGMLGAAIAAREGKLLTLATGEYLPAGRVSKSAHLIAGTMGAFVSTILAFGGWAFSMAERTSGDTIALDVPVWIPSLVFPFAFGLIALRLAWRAGEGWPARAVAA